MADQGSLLVQCTSSLVLYFKKKMVFPGIELEQNTKEEVIYCYDLPVAKS